MPNCHICGKPFKSLGIASHRAHCYDTARFYFEADPPQPGQQERYGRRKKLEDARDVAQRLAAAGRGVTIYELHPGESKGQFQAVEIERWEAAGQ